MPAVSKARSQAAKFSYGTKAHGHGSIEELCNHDLESHVFYDRVHDGYRALLKCRCEKYKYLGTKVYSTWSGADITSKVLLARGLTK